MPLSIEDIYPAGTPEDYKIPLLRSKIGDLKIRTGHPHAGIDALVISEALLAIVEDLSAEVAKMRNDVGHLLARD